IYETRIALEATAARLAAERRTSHDLALLRRVVAKQAAVDPADPEAMVSVNRQFHTAVWKASHNVSLIDLLERLDLHLARYPATTLSSPGRWSEANDQHSAVVDAIEARDGERA